VSIPEFYVGQTLVTQSQWLEIIGNNPSNFKGNNKLPVEQVSWLDAVDFCQKLSQKTGRIYRLPSEGEWEYACRAGTTSPFALLLFYLLPFPFFLYILPLRGSIYSD
jgi:eukaryotic-like serine/threonine-protein kinase